jgi:hypothetical protein
MNAEKKAETHLATFSVIIESVQTPLGFFSLVILIVSIVVLAEAHLFPQYVGWMLLACCTWITVSLALVPTMAIKWPGSIYGRIPKYDHISRQLADDVYSSLEGVMKNFYPGEQLEAWTIVANYVSSAGDSQQKEFAGIFASEIRRKAGLINTSIEPKGRIGNSPPS